MIDHLIRFDTEDDAKADQIIGSYWSAEAGWRGDICFPCRVFTETTENEITVRQYLPYWYLWLALPELDTTVTALPHCMVAADREAADRGEPFIKHSTIPPEDLGLYHVEPVIAGSNYPLGK